MSKDIKVRLYSNSKQFNNEMSSISRQMRLVKSEFDANRTSVDNWGNQLKQSEARLKYLNQSLTLQKQRVDSLKRAFDDSARVKGKDAKETQNLATRLNRATAEMNRIKGSITQTTAQMRTLEQQTSRSADRMRQFGEGMNNTGMRMRGMGMSIGIVSGMALTGLVAPMKAAFDATMNFEAGMSKVQAVSGATASELALLRGQAKDLGASTMFSASQAAEGMEKLALAGWKTKDIMAGMPGMLDLAAAGGLELAEAADITSDTMAAFGMKAKEAGHAADVFAYAQANANTNVSQMGEAMKYAAPVANALGWSLEETGAAMMKLADSGLKGSIAGQAFASSLARLAKPTKRMKAEMNKLDLAFFDAQGNMKAMPDVLAEIERGTKGMTKEQKSATLTTLFGAEAYKHWAILLEAGSDSLAKTTDELKNADGAASEMAKTMQDNVQGKITALKSAIEGLQISLMEQLSPAFMDVAEKGTEIVRGFTQMDEATQKTIGQTALLTAGVLAVTTVVAGLVAAVGAFLMFAGPIGLAITAGVALFGGLGIAIAATKMHTKNLNEVSLKNAQSLSNQAIELEKNANTFDKLSAKAKISNDELAQLHDLNNRIANAKTSDEVNKLQAQYDQLAKKSGLSKEEIDKLFKANDSLIKQSPNVEQSISDQGNAFAKNTDAVREYINSLHEMSRIELETERTKASEEKKRIEKEITEEKKKQTGLDQQMQMYTDAQHMSQGEIKSRLEEINGLMKDSSTSKVEQAQLSYEEGVLIDIQNGKYVEQVNMLQKKKEESRKSVKNSEQELEKLSLIDEQIANIRLKQAGVNEEGEKGIITLEKKLAKNHETLAGLDEEFKKNGLLTDQQQEKYHKISAQNEKMQEAQTYINQELGLYGSVNTLVESQRHLLSEGTQERIKSLEKTHEIKVAEGNILDQIQKKNGKLAEERAQLEANKEKQGANTKEIDKQIAAIDKKINAGDGVTLQMLKELDLLGLVKDGIQLNGTELQAYLEGLGYSTGEAFKLAQQLSGDTVKALEEGKDKSKQAGKDKGDAHKKGLEETKAGNKKAGTDISKTTDDELGKKKPDANKHGKEKGENYKKGLDSKKRDVENASKNLTDSSDKELAKKKTEAKKHGEDKGENYKTGLDSKKSVVVKSASDILRETLNKFGEGNGVSQSHGKAKGDSHNKGLSGTKGANTTTADTLSKNVTSKLGSTTDGGGGNKAGTMFGKGLSRTKGSVNSAGESVAGSGKAGLQSVKTSGAGEDFVSGFRRSIAAGSVWDAAWSLGKSALKALKSSIQSKSPAKLTIAEGVNFVDGLAIGITKQQGKATASAAAAGKASVHSLAKSMNSDVGAVSLAALNLSRAVIPDFNTKANESLLNQFSKHILKTSQKTANEIKKIKQETAAEEKKIETKSQKDIAAIQKGARDKKRKLTAAEARRIEKIREDSSTKIKKLSKKEADEISKITKNLTKDNFSSIETFISDKKKLERVSLADEVKIWEMSVKRFKKGTDEKRLAELKLRDAKLAYSKDIFEKEKKWIEDRKKQNQLSTLEELKAWENLSKRYKKGTEEKVAADEQAANVKKQIYDELKAASDDYLKTVQEVNQKLIEDEQKLNEEYQKALDSRAQSLYSFAGIFDEIQEKEAVSGEQLISNLKNQVVIFDDWSKNIELLAKRGVDEGLLAELREMGPKAAAEISALNELSDDYLTYYVALWKTKNQQAREQAGMELEGMKQDTANKIDELHKQSNLQLDELQADFVKRMNQLRKGSEGEFNAMAAKLPDIGVYAIQGLINGMESMRGPLVAKAKELADLARSTMQSTLDINSPSRVMRNDVGRWIPAGVAEGIDDSLHFVKSAAERIAEAAMPDMSGMAWTINGAAEAIRNSDVLTVRNIVESPDIESKLDKLLTLLEKGLLNQSPPQITQQLTFNSTKSTPSEDARKQLQASRRLAMEWRG